ncbi:TlpA family protein disulfide reductase [Vreelandella aquamarina]
MQRRYWFVSIVLVLALSGVGLWVVQHLKPEQRLPENLVMASLNGQPVDLSDFQGQPLVVNFWATWCTFCRHEMPMLETYARHEGLTLVMVNQGETVNAINDYMSDVGVSFEHILLDPVYTARQTLEVRGIPTTLFYDAKGRLITAHEGELHENQLAQFVHKYAN